MKVFVRRARGADGGREGANKRRYSSRGEEDYGMERGAAPNLRWNYAPTAVLNQIAVKNEGKTSPHIFRNCERAAILCCAVAFLKPSLNEEMRTVSVFLGIASSKLGNWILSSGSIMYDVK